jgi:YgiT-type zinc finger domain-containing protein
MVDEHFVPFEYSFHRLWRSPKSDNEKGEEIKMFFSQGCPWCGGEKSQGTTTFTVDKGNMLAVVRNVPATVCCQCGEAWILDSVAIDLEGIVSEAGAKRSQLEVIDMAA